MRSNQKHSFSFPHLFVRRDISTFWKYLGMNMLLVLFSVCALLVSNQIGVRELATENLKTIQISLDQNAEQMDSGIYQTYAIASVVGSSRLYSYFSNLTADEADWKYIPALSYLQGELQKQLLLYAECVDCFLYLPRTDNICSRSQCFANAKDCFTESLVYENLSPEEILDCLRTTQGVRLLPMQTVTFANGSTLPCISVLIRTAESTMAVMTVYSQEQILERLGFSSLPDGTGLRICSAAGETLFQFQTQEHPEQIYEVSSRLPELGCTVVVQIPKNYYTSLLNPAWKTGVMITVGTLMVGLALAFFFSRVSAKPLREMASVYGNYSEGNEVSYLDQLFRNVRSMLTNSLLIRIFSGSLLTEREERELRKSIDLTKYRWVCIIHGEEKRIETIIGLFAQQYAEQELSCVLLNQKELGVLIADQQYLLDRFRNLMTGLAEDAAADHTPLCCGISELEASLEGLHIAVHQARAIMPQNGGTADFESTRLAADRISWLQHERLFRCVFDHDEASAVALLDHIANTSRYNGGALEAFYNIRFTIRCAAEELNLDLAQIDHVDYDSSLMPRENIQHLSVMLHQLFWQIQQKRDNQDTKLQQQIVEYVQAHFCEDDLCAATIATEFKIHETRAYDALRKHCGLSLNEYLLNLRMKKAAMLLCSTQMSVEEVAQSCGYAAKSTFYRLFKKYYDASPVQYRKGTEQD